MKEDYFTLDDLEPLSDKNGSLVSNSTVKVIGIGYFGCQVINNLYEHGLNYQALVAIDNDFHNLQETKSGSRIYFRDNYSEEKKDKENFLKVKEKIENELLNIKSEDSNKSPIPFIVSDLGKKLTFDTLQIVSKISKELDIFTIGVFSQPYSFENSNILHLAEKSLEHFEEQGNAAIIFPLDYLASRIEKFKIQESFMDLIIKMLTQGIIGITDLIDIPGLINLDSYDLSMIIGEYPYGIMAFGRACGENRALSAAERAVSNIDDEILKNKVCGILFNVTGPEDLRLYEVNQIASTIRSELNQSVNLVFGAIIDENLDSEIRVTIIGTGSRSMFGESMNHKKKLSLDAQTNSNKNDKIRELSVFLCHSSSDKHDVRKLYQRLYSQVGIDPWLDEAKLLPGDNWDNKITKAVEESDIVIVCLSCNSVNKEGYVQKEIKKALDIADQKPEDTIFIIPLRLEECPVPRRLRVWQWLDYYQENSFEKLLLSLKKRARDIGINLT